ncbi:MAG: hypothetical protein NUW24_08740 [Anaerolineae bacterium]|jgi:hypothetical protein|nr:hypothetical protein [Anaerolineae bacterium]MDH7472890.1 hypothetical protein [Anaerolineae bacterium]
MKSWYVVLTIALVGALAGCSRGQATPANTSSSQSYTSAYLNTSYPNALDVSSQLALGTIQLEGTENAVTPEQAKTLLPLWQALQGGVTAQAEINAVLKQIEKTMTQEQLQAIAAMQLTQEDLQAWMQKQGLQMPGGPGWAGGPPTPGAMATRPAWSGEGEMPPEMATRRAEFENMSEEERAAMRATAEASGGIPGRSGGVRGAGGGQLRILLNPLIELLKTRAGG